MRLSFPPDFAWRSVPVAAPRRYTLRMLHKYFPHLLAAALCLLVLWSGIAPFARDVWIAEITPVLLVFGGLIWLYPRFRFSNTAYLLMAVWLFWHTVGGHYTFANVPFDWFNELIGAQRNQFDRIGHYAVGFYAFGMAEWLLRTRRCSPVLASLFSLFLIMAIAAGYEIVEWLFAVYYGGDAGIEFLGSQGDIWDAQKDMLFDTLGAFTVLILYAWLRPDRKAA
jgi:putative membrane protein